MHCLKNPNSNHRTRCQARGGPVAKEDRNQNGLNAILGDCRAGLRDILVVKIQHCYGEANKCADALASRGALLSQDFVVFLEPPTDFSLLLSLDTAGVAFDQIVNVSGVAI